MRIWFHLIGLLLAGMLYLAAPMRAAEYIVLGNGFRLQADRHEVVGDVVRIYSGEGVTEMPASLIQGFEGIQGFEAEQNEAKPAAPPLAQAPASIQTGRVETAAAEPSPQELAELAARKFALPESFVKSVMHAESGFRPDALSPKGAAGLMQLMPGTARDLGVDPSKPRENAEGGAAYLRQLLALYENRPDQVLLALAAYNAGPGAVERWHGVPPFRETREYILRVLKAWDAKSVN